MIILTFVPVIEYFYDNEKFENPFSQAFIIAYGRYSNIYFEIKIIFMNLHKYFQLSMHTIGL